VNPTKIDLTPTHFHSYINQDHIVLIEKPFGKLFGK